MEDGVSRFLVVLTVLAGLTLPGGAALAERLSGAEALAERALGDDDAPVTIVEHSSLGCPHCAAFHRDTLPKIKETYIDTGKVRLVMSDFPLGTPALAASMIARCAPAERYFPFIEVLFQSQRSWAYSENPLQALSQVARMGGMGPADVEACLKDQELLTGIRARALKAQEEKGVESTPTFFVNGEKISGNQPYAAFEAAIEKHLN
jgi:protein-disulfide isomerase